MLPLPFVLLTVLFLTPSNPAVLSIPITLAPDYTEFASSTAHAANLNATRFVKTIGCESNWDPEAKGDYVNGIPTSLGLCQLHYPEMNWGVSSSTALNPYACIILMAAAWKEGKAHLWSCY